MAGLLVVDADYIAFMAASTQEVHTIKAVSLDEKLEYTAKHRTEFKTMPIQDGYVHTDFTIHEVQDLKKDALKNAKIIMQRCIKSYMKLTDCDEVKIVIGGPTNFRDRLPLPVKYKGNRDNTIRPVLLKDCRLAIVDLYDTETSDDEEADDLISKYQYEGSINPEKRIVVCSPDKDVRGTPGLAFNPQKKVMMDIKGFGFLQLDTKVSASNKKTYSLYGEGRLWFYSQLVLGDDADGYHPYDFSGTSKISPTQFYKRFSILTTDKECWTELALIYRTWFSEVTSWTDWRQNTVEGTWIDILQLYCDVVHMRRWNDDRIDVRKVLKSFEIIE